MTTDLILAIFHHMLVFGLAITMAVELGRLRPGMTGAEAIKLARLDAGYGATAGLILVVGVLRVIYGVKGADYYLHNPWFWAKMAAFAGVGLLSVPPTIAFIRWRKSATADAGFAPADAQVAGVRRFLICQVGLLMVLVACAAAMARLG